MPTAALTASAGLAKDDGARCFGNLGRGTLDGPGLFRLDMGFYKTIPIKDTAQVVISTAISNLLNPDISVRPTGDLRRWGALRYPG